MVYTDAKRYGCTTVSGAGWGHAVSMARSRNIAGPCDLHPDTYILSARHRPDAELQRAGHADLVETQAVHLSHDETVGKHLRVMSCLPDSAQTDAFTPPVPIPAGRPVGLCVEVDCKRLLFAYRVEGVDNDWRWLPQQLDASILSDEATAPGLPNSTGAFVGMACQDLAGTLRPADFDFFEYQERAYRVDPFSAW